MVAQEGTRLVLFLFEWIWTVSVLAVFPDQLITRATLDDGSAQRVEVCKFNYSIGLSRCNFGIAWASIAFIVLTAAVTVYLMEYCTSVYLPQNVEFIVFAWLTVWWFIGAITLTATKAGNAPRAATAAVVLSWMLLIMSAVSTWIANLNEKSHRTDSRTETDIEEGEIDSRDLDDEEIDSTYTESRD